MSQAKPSLKRVGQIDSLIALYASVEYLEYIFGNIAWIYIHIYRVSNTVHQSHSCFLLTTPTLFFHSKCSGNVKISTQAHLYCYIINNFNT